MQTTVLNVDDNPANRYVRSRALRSAGFEVIEAGTGQSALAIAREQRPSLLLLDVKLPDMSGLEVCRELRRDDWARRIGIIHISATYLDIETESLNAGADIYLAEPVEQTELLSAVRTLVRLRRTEERLIASEERMRLAMDAAGIATWDIDMHTGEAVWCERFHALMGLPPGGMQPSLAAWLERIAPAERESFRAAMEAAVGADAPLEHQHWIIRADNGERRCISVHGKLRPPGRLIGVALDVSERRRAEAEREVLLEHARAGQRSAEEAARIKDEFLAVLSHELRTPLTAVLGWIQLVRSGKLSDQQMTTAFEVIERNALLQIHLVNDLLDVSEIVAGKMKLDMRPVALDTVLATSVESMRPRADEKRIELDVSIEERASIVSGSEERLEQVFNNLLSNAVKFTRPGGRVAVSLRRTGSRARIEIADDGEGISPQALPHLFDRFWQADSTNRRKYGGLGLGLAIVRSIVEMHGGTVEASSAGIGCGATLTVTLPLSNLVPVTDERHAAPAPISGVRGFKLLVVDDHTDALEMLAMVLQAEGAQVRCASTGDAACDIVTQWTPDVLILDLAMPGEDGFTLLKRLRALRPGGASIPAIALTGYAGGEARDRAVSSGFQAHLAKPFDTQELLNLIGTLTGKAAKRLSPSHD